MCFFRVLEDRNLLSVGLSMATWSGGNRNGGHGEYDLLYSSQELVQGWACCEFWSSSSE